MLPAPLHRKAYRDTIITRGSRTRGFGSDPCFGARDSLQALVSGAAAARVKTIVTDVPWPGLDSTSRPALAFSRRDFTISALSLPRFGHSIPSGRPTPSSAITKRQPLTSARPRHVTVPPARPLNACFSALVISPLTTSPAGIATLTDTGYESTLR